jgi:hypothetical protein
VGMFSDLKLAKLELQNMEDNQTNEWR